MTALPTGVVLQSRGVGALEAVRAGLPAWATEAFALLTHLGDTATLLLLAVAVYLWADRRRGAFVLGALLLGFAVTYLLKAGLALPRPPPALRYVAASGYGFPSGHAVGSTVGFGALAIALEGVSTARRRAAAAGLGVVVVSASRVAIGVHYLVDVVAGVAIGLAVLAVAVRVGRPEPLASFGLAGGVAAGAAAVSGAGTEAVLLLGAAVGAISAWQVVEPRDRPWGRRGMATAAGAGGLALLVSGLLDPTRAVLFGAAALATAAVLMGPVLAEGFRPASIG